MCSRIIPSVVQAPVDRSLTDTKRLNILFVTPYLPSPPGFGGQRRMHELISTVAKFHRVSILSLVDPSVDHAEAIAATRAYADCVVTVPNPRFVSNVTRNRMLQLRSVLSFHSHQHILHSQPALQRALDRILADEQFDIVQVEFSQIATNCRRRSKRAPVFVLDEHNIEYDILRRTAEARDSSLHKRTFCRMNWRKMRNEELNAWANFDGCVLTSTRDEQLLLADAPDTQTTVVPNGVDLDAFAPTQGQLANTSATLLFFGALEYYPNTDGMLFFLREVLPALRRTHPAVRVRIVGPRPPESLLAFRSDSVELTGAVPSVYPYIEDAAVCIAPLRIGGGTRLKILESMAAQRPVVSTTLGAEGIELVPERDALIADDPLDFARQIGRLLDDRALAERIAASGRKVVAENYSWRRSVAQLDAFYDRLLNEPSRMQL